MTDTERHVLRVCEISKAFPGVQALDEVSFDLVPGEVHALVGENGAGKSTLVQILSGIYRKDKGIIEIDGLPHDFENKRDAEEAGIAMVFQESSLLQNLTVMENLFSSEPPRTPLGLINWRAMEREGRELLDRLRIRVDLDVEVGSLSVATQKMIEIARALSQDFKILILDEPTASITVEETAQLFTLIGKLKSDGKSIIYISHRIEEIRSIAERVTVLKDGKYVGTYPVGEITDQQICEKMVGRELLSYRYTSRIRDAVIMEVKNLSGSRFEGVSFRLQEGEYLTITGLTGAGRTELALTLFGLYRSNSGTVLVDGRETRFRSPEDAMRAGIGYVSEDRKKLGLFLDMTVAENMESANMETVNPGPVISRKRILGMSLENIDKFGIRCNGPDQIVHDLSGGNQQKVCLSRWFTFKPRILIVDEPTLGVDVGSKEEIYTKLNDLAKGGMSIIMISSDMIETLSMGDRIMVMHSGRVMDIREREICDEPSVVALASGMKGTKA